MRKILCIVMAIGFMIGTVQAAELPATIGDREFWQLITGLSESGGLFPQQFMSNEDSAQFVIPALKQRVPQRGVYLGVGSEQNFTYIAALQPRIAFVVDIRRDNMLEHLVYKALFELSTDRADFVSRLFSRRRPSGLNSGSGVKDLFDAYQPTEVDARLYETNLRAVMDCLLNVHALPLDEADKAGIARVLDAFRRASPHTLRGMGDLTNPTYADLMTAADLTGRTQSFLASEDSFKFVRDLQKKNLVIPVVGDFAGDKALAGIGGYLRERDSVVNVFYVSNVERYLFDQGEHGRRFYANAAALPLDPSSLFIRSVTSDISQRLSIPIPPGTTKWRTFLTPISDCLKAVEAGRIQNYRDLF